MRSLGHDVYDFSSMILAFISPQVVPSLKYSKDSAELGPHFGDFLAVTRCEYSCLRMDIYIFLFS